MGADSRPIICPKCGCDNIQERTTRKPQPYRCRGCRKDFSVKTDTLMHSSPLGFCIWASAIFLSTTNIKGIASMKLHRDLKVTLKTAWHLAHRIRESWQGESSVLSGPAESDSLYRRKDAMNHQLKRPRRRPVEKEWPETIPDTPENVARAIMAGPPKREWNYLKDPVLPLG